MRNRISSTEIPGGRVYKVFIYTMRWASIEFLGRREIQSNKYYQSLKKGKLLFWCHQHSSCLLHLLRPQGSSSRDGRKSCNNCVAGDMHRAPHVQVWKPEHFLRLICLPLSFNFVFHKWLHSPACRGGGHWFSLIKVYLKYKSYGLSILLRLLRLSIQQSLMQKHRNSGLQHKISTC